MKSADLVSARSVKQSKTFFFNITIKFTRQDGRVTYWDFKRTTLKNIFDIVHDNEFKTNWKIIR